MEHGTVDYPIPTTQKGGYRVNAESRLEQLGERLPECPIPRAAYVPAVMAGGFIYASGQIPRVGTGLRYAGKLGDTVSVEQGYEAARICALRCLAEIKSVVGSLDNVKRIVKVTGYVASAPGFGDQPKVIDGASELLQSLFGPRGQHARAAIGVAQLPSGACVEVEIIAEAVTKGCELWAPGQVQV